MNRSENFCRAARSLAAALSMLCGLATAHAADGYVKDAASGCAVFKPNLKAGESVSWQGACSDGSAQGRGVARWSAPDGSTLTFTGTFAQGRLQGLGTMVAASGDRYEGLYKDGLRDGRGTYLSANGDRYEGEYKNNLRHGRGVATTAAKGRVEGEWRNGDPIAPGAQPEVLAAQGTAQTSTVAAAPPPLVAPPPRPAPSPKAMPTQQALVPVQQSAQPPAQRQADMMQRQSAGQQRTMDMVLGWLLLGSPLILALVVTQAKWGGAVSFADQVGQWVEARHDKVKLKDGFFSRWVQRPTLWCIRQVFVSSAQVQNQFLRAGVRLASALYIVGVVLFLAYVVTVVVLTVVVLGVMLWVLGLFLGDGDTSSSRGVASKVAKGIMRSGESRRREGVFGPYDETRDDDGTVMSESRQREGVFGSYVETRDADGNVISESRQRDGVFGSYTETRDNDGKVIAESRQREGVLGPYVETRDATGKVVSESRDREGLFGSYTEHKKVDK